MPTPPLNELLSEVLDVIEDTGMSRSKAIDAVAERHDLSGTTRLQLEASVANQMGPEPEPPNDKPAQNSRSASASSAGTSKPAEDEDGLDPRAADAARRAIDALEDDDPSNDEDARTSFSVLSDSILVGSMPAEIEQDFGGRPFTPDEVEMAIDFYNATSPIEPVQNGTDLYHRYLAGDFAAIEALTSVRSEQSAEFVRVTVPLTTRDGRRTVDVSRREFDAYRQLMPGSTTAFGRIVGWADRYGMPRPVLAGIYNSLGLLDPVSPEADQVGEFREGLETDAGARRFTDELAARRARRPGGERQAISRVTDSEVAFTALRRRLSPGDVDRLDRLHGQLFTEAYERLVADQPDIDDRRRRLEAAREAYAGAVERLSPEGWASKQRFGQIVRQQRAADLAVEAYRELGNWGLAIIATHDQELAREIRATGSVPDQATASRVAQILFDAGYDAQTWANLGRGDYDGYAWDSILGNFGIGGAGAAEREVVQVPVPDQASVAQGLRSMYQQLFMAEPTDEELAAFSSELTNHAMSLARTEYDAARGGDVNPFEVKPGGAGANFAPSTSIDVGAQMETFAQRSERYRRLYHNKPQGMSDIDYAQFFRGTIDRFAGDVISAQPEAFRAGLETGDAQTAIGQLALNRDVFENSSDFRGRLAQAAQVISRML